MSRSKTATKSAMRFEERIQDLAGRVRKCLADNDVEAAHSALDRLATYITVNERQLERWDMADGANRLLQQLYSDIQAQEVTSGMGSMALTPSRRGRGGRGGPRIARPVKVTERAPKSYKKLYDRMMADANAVRRSVVSGDIASAQSRLDRFRGFIEQYQAALQRASLDIQANQILAELENIVGGGAGGSGAMTLPLIQHTGSADAVIPRYPRQRPVKIGEGAPKSFRKLRDRMLADANAVRKSVVSGDIASAQSRLDRFRGFIEQYQASLQRASLDIEANQILAELENIVGGGAGGSGAMTLPLIQHTGSADAVIPRYPRQRPVKIGEGAPKSFRKLRDRMLADANAVRKSVVSGDIASAQSRLDRFRGFIEQYQASLQRASLDIEANQILAELEDIVGGGAGGSGAMTQPLRLTSSGRRSPSRGRSPSAGSSGPRARPVKIGEGAPKSFRKLRDRMLADANAVRRSVVSGDIASAQSRLDRFRGFIEQYQASLQRASLDIEANQILAELENIVAGGAGGSGAMTQPLRYVTSGSRRSTSAGPRQRPVKTGDRAPKMARKLYTFLMDEANAVRSLVKTGDIRGAQSRLDRLRFFIEENGKRLQKAELDIQAQQILAELESLTEGGAGGSGALTAPMRELPDMSGRPEPSTSITRSRPVKTTLHSSTTARGRKHAAKIKSMLGYIRAFLESGDFQAARRERFNLRQYIDANHDELDELAMLDWAEEEHNNFGRLLQGVRPYGGLDSYIEERNEERGRRGQRLIGEDEPEPETSGPVMRYPGRPVR